MHNLDDPINFFACRDAGYEMASISCIAAGSLKG